MRHTPGPWTTRHTDELNAAIHADEYGVIADVNLCRDDGTANARLIAAAPDLLAALEALLTKLSAKLPALQYHDCKSEYEAARAAIRTATEELMEEITL